MEELYARFAADDKLQREKFIELVRTGMANSASSTEKRATEAFADCDSEGKGFVTKAQFLEFCRDRVAFAPDLVDLLSYGMMVPSLQFDTYMDRVRLLLHRL